MDSSEKGHLMVLKGSRPSSFHQRIVYQARPASRLVCYPEEEQRAPAAPGGAATLQEEEELQREVLTSLLHPSVCPEGNTSASESHLSSSSASRTGPD